jgi:hypothetical protein
MYYYSFSYLSTSVEKVEGDSCGYISTYPATTTDFINLVKSKQTGFLQSPVIQIIGSKIVSKEEYQRFYL